MENQQVMDELLARIEEIKVIPPGGILIFRLAPFTTYEQIKRMQFTVSRMCPDRPAIYLRQDQSIESLSDDDLFAAGLMRIPK